MSNETTVEDTLTKKKQMEEFKPNYDFIKTREMCIKDFYNTLFVQFGHYRAVQRIPRLDGLAETQRKVIWTALKKKYKKKINLSYIMADVGKISNYHHGPVSLENVLNNLIAVYKNGLPFLKVEGSFGSRSNRNAAASRYTKSRNTEYLEAMFNEEDIAATFGYRTIDGSPAEPITLYPILPLGIINGQSQTSVGFATELLPRDPKTILDLFIGILKGEITQIPGYMPPKWPLCEAPVELIGHNQWESRGIVEKKVKKRKQIIEITEVPFNMDGDRLVILMDKHKDKGLIESYRDATNSNKFSVEIIAPKLWNLSENEIVQKLELTASITEQFVYIDGESKFVMDCKTFASYINYFIIERLKVYEARKTYRLEKYAYDLNKLVAMINYINEINLGKIEFRNKTEEEIIAQLQTYGDSYGFKPMLKRFAYIDPSVKAYIKNEYNYDYLFDIPIRSFTPKKIVALQEKYKEVYDLYMETNSIPATKMWLEDLENFEKLMAKHGWNK